MQARNWRNRGRSKISLVKENKYTERLFFQVHGKPQTLQGTLPACSKWEGHKLLPAKGAGRCETTPDAEGRLTPRAVVLFLAKLSGFSYIVKPYHFSLYWTFMEMDQTWQMISERNSPFQIFFYYYLNKK